jgi:hypothetical protein
MEKSRLERVIKLVEELRDEINNDGCFEVKADILEFTKEGGRIETE